MNSFSSDHNNNNNEEATNNSSRDNNNNNNTITIFSPSLPQPQHPPSQSSRPFWNFISPTAPSLSHQLMFHASTSTNARPISYNNASALSLSLTHRPRLGRAIGGGGGGSGSGSSSSMMISSNQQYPHQRPLLLASAPQPPPRMRAEQLMAAAVAAARASSRSHFPSPSPPCTECGRRFPSSKALFGHMRCHPERTWRGIKPPLNARAPASTAPKAADWKDQLTGSELDVVEALLVLATGVEHKLERTGDTSSPRGEDSARSVGASTEQYPAGQEGGQLEEEVVGEGEGEGGGEGAGKRSASSSSTMRYVLDLNLPPPPEDTEGGDGTDM